MKVKPKLKNDMRSLLDAKANRAVPVHDINAIGQLMDRRFLGRQHRMITRRRRLTKSLTARIILFSLVVACWSAIIFMFSVIYRAASMTYYGG